jgi:hypothetical protein
MFFACCKVPNGSVTVKYSKNGDWQVFSEYIRDKAETKPKQQ